MTNALFGLAIYVATVGVMLLVMWLIEYRAWARHHQYDEE